jgi:hypothetical protein
MAMILCCHLLATLSKCFFSNYHPTPLPKNKKKRFWPKTSPNTCFITFKKKLYNNYRKTNFQIYHIEILKMKNHFTKFSIFQKPYIDTICKNPLRKSKICEKCNPKTERKLAIFCSRLAPQRPRPRKQPEPNSSKRGHREGGGRERAEQTGRGRASRGGRGRARRGGRVEEAQGEEGMGAGEVGILRAAV